MKTKPDQKCQCSARVFRGHMGGSPCSIPAKVERHGRWFCHTHDPVVIDAREAARKKERDAKWAAQQKRWADQKKEAARAEKCVKACARLANPVQDLLRVRDALQNIAEGSSQVRRGRGGQGITHLTRENMMQLATMALAILEPPTKKKA